jgi:scyllo-inositol 2-dehydrogenase (NADP+)
MNKQLTTAVVGFGLSGKVFHTPFIQAHPGFRLSKIMTSGKDARQKYPECRIVRDFEEVLSDPKIDLVVIASPNEFHFSQAKRALEAGKDVILEKPLTPTVQEAAELFRIAEACGKHIFPFQNRRWDGDFLTIRHIMEEGYLGEVLDFESHFDRYNPEVGRASWRYNGTPAGGTLYDLGIHLIDQAVVLFGAPEAVFCRLFNQRENSVTDDSFDLKLIYPQLNVTVKAGVFVREPGPRFSIHGRLGSYVKYGLDPQEAELRKGKVPGIAGWGAEARKNWGLLHTEFNGKKIRVKYETMQGNYMAFFDNVYEVIFQGKEQAVKPKEVMTSLRMIEQAMESDRKKTVLKFSL